MHTKIGMEVSFLTAPHLALDAGVFTLKMSSEFWLAYDPAIDADWLPIRSSASILRTRLTALAAVSPGSERPMQHHVSGHCGADMHAFDRLIK